jgi:hypothetical protein
LSPTFEERVIGTADVRETFQVPKIGTIAGCSVIAGKMSAMPGYGCCGKVWWSTPAGFLRSGVSRMMSRRSDRL